jgi:hypothetical protein
MDHGFIVMCRAMKRGPLNIQELSVDHYREEALESGLQIEGISPGSFQFSPRDLEECCTAFSQLRRVAFAVTQGLMHEDWDISLRGNFAAILAAATELEELTLCSPNGWSRLSALVLGTHIWPRLRSLRLLNMAMYQGEIVGFLKRHCKTLKGLCMAGCFLWDENWASFARELRQGLSLESARFYRMGDHEEPDDQTAFCEQLEKYILGTRSEFLATQQGTTSGIDVIIKFCDNAVVLLKSK